MRVIVSNHARQRFVERFGDRLNMVVPEEKLINAAKRANGDTFSVIGEYGVRYVAVVASRGDVLVMTCLTSNLGAIPLERWKDIPHEDRRRAAVNRGGPKSIDWSKKKRRNGRGRHESQEECYED